MERSKEKQAAYDKIAALVEHFASQIDVFKKNQNEPETRNQFINPLFDALGWDIDNTKRRAIDSDRDVVHEGRLKIEGKSKAPDYSFRVGGKRKFFLEAKKPSIKIETDIIPSYQLRRYGWNDPDLQISILTDFEEFALYDCTMQPSATDAAIVGRLKYITYDQYLEKFDWLWDTFSKEQVIKGSLDQFTKSVKKGTQSVDSAFLQSLDEWRNYLATSIALRNKHLNEDEINYLVQMNINRIVFIRNCEDRGVEPYGKLKGCLVNSKDEGGYFQNMYQVFEDADRKYNSGLFDFTKDTLSKSVIIDNEIIKNIVDELYFPKSPYEFSVIGVEILGTAYEQFLGKVIRLTPDHQAVVEEKPEVRKAGGVFYTPQYIVEYIVKQTVGKLVDGKTPDEIAKIKICDPSCGSGSFLLGAYQFLLTYYTDWFIKHYKKSSNLKDSPLTPDGRLTTHVKKQILLNNIFGVDIDTQAVEVTKLSLLMKCMEGETAASMQTTLTFERVLPTLENNIKSGNSLIDFDFYEGQIDYGEDKKIKPFNWKSAFPQVFKLGGFDAVIGNPPYGMADDNDEKIYFQKKYVTTEGRFDKFELFIEKGYELLKKASGKFGFIIPSPILTNVYSRKLRQFLLENTSIQQVVNFNMPVFQDPTVHTCVLTFELPKNITSSIEILNTVSTVDELQNEGFRVAQSEFGNATNYVFDIFFDAISSKIIGKLQRTSNELGNICYIRQCIKTGNDEIYVKKSQSKLEEPWKPSLRGKSISRYQTTENNIYLKYGDWLARNWKNKSFYETPKIAIRETGNRIIATIDLENRYFLSSIYAIYFKENTGIDLKFVLGLLNSNVATWFIKIIALNLTEGAFTKVRTNQLARLPIPKIESKSSLGEHNEIVKNVDLLLKINADLQTESDVKKKEQMQGRIAYAEQRINEIVCKLYGLTKEEIQIIEN